MKAAVGLSVQRSLTCNFPTSNTSQFGANWGWTHPDSAFLPSPLLIWMLLLGLD